jgi:hypothetical protein
MDELFWGKDLEDVFIELKYYKWQKRFRNMTKTNYSRSPGLTSRVKQKNCYRRLNSATLD